MNTAVDLTEQKYIIERAIVDNGRYIFLSLRHPIDNPVKNMEVHPPQGEGDKWFLRVQYENDTFHDFFNIVEILWMKPEAK